MNSVHHLTLNEMAYTFIYLHCQIKLQSPDWHCDWLMVRWYSVSINIICYTTLSHTLVCWLALLINTVGIRFSHPILVQLEMNNVYFQWHTLVYLPVNIHVVQLSTNVSRDLLCYCYCVWIILQSIVSSQHISFTL